ncbi:hypothetical protein EJB05_45624 [Eragrostis curvula]|uniref:MADS-box domain-containing protein n=1 Tax=Eragrostis curvula TaxID=38414 RepID=A0A5J9TKU5_9POAL|nr:hypothetical protein EJB05_45624 [Eragrostis curvula]
MGRVKLQIKRIENNTNRQVTYSKRRNGLIKKAYELSVLCDIDIALIMFSPSQRLSHFSGRRRIEDVITRYINLPEHDRGGIVRNREYLMKMLTQLRCEGDIAEQLTTTNKAPVNSNIEELQQEIRRYQHQVQLTEERLRLFEPDTAALASMAEIEACEKFLMDTLARVEDRKQYLLSNHIDPFDPSASDMQHVFLPPQHEQQGDMAAVNAFGGDVVSSWFADSMPSIFAGPDPVMSFREQAMYDDPMRRDPVVDPGMPMCHVDQQGPSDDWQQAYTSAELLSALIPSTPFPLDDQIPAVHIVQYDSHKLDPAADAAASWLQDAMAPVLTSPMPHELEPVEAAGSSSHVPAPGDDGLAGAMNIG